MGEPAVWLKSDGSTIEGNILFKYPTRTETIGDADKYEYPPNKPSCEWFKDTFVGLKELSDAQSFEYLIIRDRKYLVTLVETKVDGDNYVANLDLTAWNVIGSKKNSMFLSGDSDLLATFEV